MPNWKKVIVSGSSAYLSNLNVDNAVTASYFKGDGSALTNVQTSIAETATVSDTFTSVTTKAVTHNFDTKNVIVTVYNDSDEQIIPSSIVTTTVNTVTVNFDTATTGRVVVAKGGHIVQGVGTASDSNTLNSQSGSYYLDYANHTGAVTASVVSSSYIDLNVITSGNEPIHKEGRLFYSQEEGALSVYNDEADITLQVGQEFWIRAFNPTDSIILNGTPVRASGSQGDRIAIYPALAENHTQGVHFDSHIIGVATHDIEASSEGYVTAQGIVRGVDTTAFSAGDTLYLQTGSAGLRNDPPPFPYDIVQVGYASKIAANGFIFVEPKEPVHFNNISGLSGSVQGPGDLWIYQGNNAWSPGKVLSGSYTIDNGDFTFTNGNIQLQNGNISVTGSLVTSGSQTRFLAYPWPAIGEEVHLLKTDGYEIVFNEATRSYEYHGIALEHIENGNNYYHNSLALYTYSSGSDFGGEINIGPVRTHMRQHVSGSDSFANISVQELADGRSQALIYGDRLELGVYRGASIQLGNTSSYLSISASSINIASDITASGHLIPGTNETYDLGTPSERWRDLYISGGTIYLGDTIISQDTVVTTDNLQTSLPQGVISSSAQIASDISGSSTALSSSLSIRLSTVESPTFYKLAVSGSTSYNITHSLAEEFPIVQVYDSSSKQQVMPATITSSTENVVQLTFDNTFNGTVVVKK